MKFNITAHRRIWFSFSGILMGVSLALIAIFGLNLGLDFTGGARWDLQFVTEQNAETDQTAPTVTKQQLENFFAAQPNLTKDTLVQASDVNTFLITIEDMPDSEIQALAGKIRSEIGEFEEKSYRKVDATIGASFKTKALYAIVTALVGMILFVAFAFRRIPEAIGPWRFGGVAIMALFHDILILLGIFVLLGALVDVELDLPFITALLATLGFSINDTIVILDRVRENIRLQKGEETFTDTVEKSVQQTLFRSLNTSVSTLFPLVGLLFFGAESIFYFVLALTIGIAIGTYSSIFLAAPLLVEWKVLRDAREK